MLRLNIMADTKISDESDIDKEIDDSSKDKMVKRILRKQLKNIKSDMKLMFKDIKRICKNMDGDLFHKTKCCLWQGNITNSNNRDKGRYINFYFNGKKRALHRLLYSNFVGYLAPDEYLKFKCKNKGVCCNITHLEKFKYKESTEQTMELSEKKKTIKKSKSADDVIVERREGKKNSKLILRFD